MIRHNLKSETPHNLLFFDTETTEDDLGGGVLRHTLQLGVACFQRFGVVGKHPAPVWCDFKAKQGFYDFLEAHARPKQRLVCFCHNTSFDLPVLDVFTELPLRGWKLHRAVIEAPPTMLTFRKGERTIRFLDTLNFWRMKLADIARIVGMEKGEWNAVKSTSESLTVYCRNDVDILRRAVLGYLETLKTLDLGGFADTLASQAFRAWRHRFMPVKVAIHDHDFALSLERDCYHGGRTECFYIGKAEGRFTLVDINSMYPSVMMGNFFPIGLRGYSRRWSIEGLRRILVDHLVCARVIVRTLEPRFPVRRDGKLYFPTGEFETCLSTPELKDALFHDEVREVLEGACYKRGDIFTNFVTEMYALRQRLIEEGQSEQAFTIKILMNSLYGKFGQHGFKYELSEFIPDLSAKLWDEVILETGKRIHHRQLAGLHQILTDTPESAESFPAIAAHVTAYARMLLWRDIERAGRGNVYYADTDSLLVNDAGLSNLSCRMDAQALGMLKVEGEYSEIEIHGPKDYRFGNREKLKGVRKNAIRVGENVYRQVKWSSLKGLLRRGDLTAPLTSMVDKHLSRTYDKGTVEMDGWVTPLFETRQR